MPSVLRVRQSSPTGLKTTKCGLLQAPPRLPLGKLQPHLNLNRCSPLSEFRETALRGALSYLVSLPVKTFDKRSQIFRMGISGTEHCGPVQPASPGCLRHANLASSGKVGTKLALSSPLIARYSCRKSLFFYTANVECFVPPPEQPVVPPETGHPWDLSSTSSLDICRLKLLSHSDYLMRWLWGCQKATHVGTYRQVITARKKPPVLSYFLFHSQASGHACPHLQQR